ncbi:MAG: BtpA/SgcQ family protein [Eubacteriales bacterium]|nr:BtpA/SgcQ family protein [Eubacteriales bacterium]
MWTEELFHTGKPVIGMIHLLGMPTDPKYDPDGGIQKILDTARRDLHALQDGGIDGVLFCNEFSIPYTDNVKPVTIAVMARIIGELMEEIKVPHGVCVAMDPLKGYDLAAAVEAKFIRQTIHGTTAGVYGITNVQPGEVERHKVEVGCKDIKTLTPVIPEGTEQVAKRPIEEVAKTLCFNVNPSALLIYSNTPGSSIDVAQVSKVKGVTDTPVFASNGVKPETVKDILAVADGCIVGTGIKVDGKFENPVDPERTKELMANAREARGES